MSNWILLPVLLPAITGIFLLTASFLEHPGRGKSCNEKEKKEDGTRLHLVAGVILAVSVITALYTAWNTSEDVVLFWLMKDIPIYFHIDEISRLFVTVASIVWAAVGGYSFLYMSHEGEEKRFFGVYLLVYGVLVALDFSGNLVTMYLFYELLTLTSMPLVLHNGSREAIMASLKYLFYSMCGAYMGLFGIFFLYQYCETLTFTAGGTLNAVLAAENRRILLIAVFAMVVGFGAKAGMLPLHSWLPTAHPVAPSPASAVLSGVIVKAGVLAVIRTVYYVVGPDFLRGTWVQTAWMSLTLLTVFMGSMLAYREPVFKKRLAYSTVSQISYILFGLALMSPTAFAGALLHTVFHAFIKSALFLTAGIFIFRFGKTRAEELKGIGEKLPVTLWCYTFASMALIGLPPTGGFISKWFLAQGALEAEVGIFRLAGPVVLLVSAFLTAGYLLPVTMRGFFPGKNAETVERAKEHAAVGDLTAGKTQAASEASLGWMVVPVSLLAALSVLGGIFSSGLIEYAGRIASTLM